MNRKEYLKKYRENHIEKYREYQRKYRKNNLSSYDKLKLKKDSLIKYLEKKIKENQILVCNNTIREIQDIYLAKVESYQDILERVKNNNYE